MTHPAGPWVMVQRWHDLLFAHWRCPITELRPLIPEPLEIDTFDGSAWIGVIPFYMSGVRMRATPPVPTANAFEELNVRTYVTLDGRPGIWFFSLDCASSLAVLGARIGIYLPYFRASMSMVRNGERHRIRQRALVAGRQAGGVRGALPAGRRAVPPGARHARSFSDRALLPLFVCGETHLARRHCSSAMEPAGRGGDDRA